MHQGLQLPVALRLCLTSYGKGLKEAKKRLKIYVESQRTVAEGLAGF